MYNRQQLTDYIVRVARAARAGHLHRTSTPFEASGMFPNKCLLNPRPGNHTEFDDAALSALVDELVQLLGMPDRGG